MIKTGNEFSQSSISKSETGISGVGVVSISAATSSVSGFWKISNIESSQSSISSASSSSKRVKSSGVVGNFSVSVIARVVTLSSGESTGVLSTEILFSDASGVATEALLSSFGFTLGVGIKTVSGSNAA